ncbi:MAG: hypothetical protein M3320_00655 [Actinomycetota bacterium]|nr:hypothetical protein [Actinomycetota bacterium]
MPRRLAVTAAVTAALALPAAVPTAAPAAVVDCNTWAFYPNLKISSARNMTCKAAKRDIRRHREGISRTFRTPGGFRCRRVSGTELGGQWRCVKGAKAYRFEFGD